VCVKDDYRYLGLGNMSNAMGASVEQNCLSLWTTWIYHRFSHGSVLVNL